jgi:hypothetical protein
MRKESMDWSILYIGNPYKIVHDNVFFMYLSETCLVTENDKED